MKIIFDSERVRFCVINRTVHKNGKQRSDTHDLPLSLLVKDATKYV